VFDTGSYLPISLKQHREKAISGPKLQHGRCSMKPSNLKVKIFQDEKDRNFFFFLLLVELMVAEMLFE